METETKQFKSTVGPGYKNFVLFTLFLAWCLGGVDRTVISFAAIPIGKEFGLNPVDIGKIFSMFFFGYMLMQIPGGFLVDKFGPKKVLLTIVFCWSIFTAATGLVGGLTSMLVVRFIFGMAEAPFSASATVTISQIFFAKDRGRATSLYLSSSGVVMIFAPIIAANMIEAVGWRMMFFILGAFGVVIVGLFYYVFQGDKLEAARALVTEKVETLAAKPAVSFSRIMKIPMVWYILLANFTAYTLLWGIGNWMPTYLVKEFGINLKEAGTLQAIPGFGSFAGLLISGFIIDRLSDRGNRIFCFVISVICTIALYALYLGNMSITMIIIIQTIANLVVGYIAVYILAIAMKKLPVAVIGKVNGTGLFFAYLGSTLAPTIMGMLAQAGGGKISASFIYLFAASVVMTIAMAMMNPSIDKHLES